MIRIIRIVALVVVFELSGCGLFGEPVRYGETVVRNTAGGPTMAVKVLPSKQYWRKPGASRDDMIAAGVDCTSKLRSDREYVALLNEWTPITRASMQRTITRVQKKRENEIRERLANLEAGCMTEKGYEFVRRGFSIER